MLGPPAVILNAKREGPLYLFVIPEGNLRLFLPLR